MENTLTALATPTNAKEAAQWAWDAEETEFDQEELCRHFAAITGNDFDEMMNDLDYEFDIHLWTAFVFCEEIVGDDGEAL